MSLFQEGFSAISTKFKLSCYKHAKKRVHRENRALLKEAASDEAPEIKKGVGLIAGSGGFRQSSFFAEEIPQQVSHDFWCNHGMAVAGFLHPRPQLLA